MSFAASVMASIYLLRKCISSLAALIDSSCCLMRFLVLLSLVMCHVTVAVYEAVGVHKMCLTCFGRGLHIASGLPQDHCMALLWQS